MLILENKVIAPGIFRMELYAPKIAETIKPGQFVNLYTGDNAMLLPRPLSVCYADKDRGELRLVYQVVGKGTLLFSSLKQGENIRVMGPFGTGFPIHEELAVLANDSSIATLINGNSAATLINGNSAATLINGNSAATLIGGGVGIAPLLELARSLKSAGAVVKAYLGFSGRAWLVEEFKEYCDEVNVFTEGLIPLETIAGSGHTYACGPLSMLKALAALGTERLYVSMEERMGCGFGACLGCAIMTKDGTYKRVCKDGPVFLADEIDWGWPRQSGKHFLIETALAEPK